MSEHEIQQLIDAILSPHEPVAGPEAVQTRDGQIASQMHQQALLQLTSHPSIPMRQQAAELLGESKQAAALQALLKLAGDAESEVRQQALSSLEHFPDPSATQALIAALSDGDYLVQATAAEVLGGRHDPLAVEPLMHSLQDSNAMVRATAAEALGRMEAFMAAPALRDQLLDADQWVRYSVAESLSQIESDEPIWPLLMNANSADLDLRLEAIAALGKLGDRRAIPALVKMLNDGFELEEAILNTLEHFHDPLAIPALVELALFTEKPHVREQALIQAQQLGLRPTLEDLTGWLDPDRPQYAQKAIEVLHQLPTADTTPIFLYALEHPDPWVQTVALITLEERRTAAPTELLLPLLAQSNEHDLVRAALRNLISHHPQQTAQAIETFLSSEAEWRRQALAENLSRLPLERALELAPRLLDDPGTEVREATLRSLSARVSPQSLPLLLSGSRDSDAWVRQAAIEGLGGSDLPAASERLIELLAGDEDFLVRAAAAEALSTQQGEAVRKALASALTDSKASVRLQAAHSLFAQTSPLSAELLRQLLADEDKSVVLATLQQLRKQPEPAVQPQIEALRQSEDAQIRSAAENIL